MFATEDRSTQVRITHHSFRISLPSSFREGWSHYSFLYICYSLTCLSAQVSSGVKHLRAWGLPSPQSQTGWRSRYASDANRKCVAMAGEPLASVRVQGQIRITVYDRNTEVSTKRWTFGDSDDQVSSCSRARCKLQGLQQRFSTCGSQPTLG